MTLIIAINNIAPYKFYFHGTCNICPDEIYLPICYDMSRVSLLSTFSTHLYADFKTLRSSTLIRPLLTERYVCARAGMSGKENLSAFKVNLKSD